MAVIAAPDAGDFTIRLDRLTGVPDTQPYTLSVVVPDAQGHLRQFVFQNVAAGQLPALTFTAADPYRLSIAAAAGGQTIAAAVAPVDDPPPSIIGVVQQIQADQVCVDVGKTLGLWAPGARGRGVVQRGDQR